MPRTISRDFLQAPKSTRVDPCERADDRLRIVWPDEPVDFAAVAEEACERLVDERRRAAANAAPRRAEVEDDRSLQRIDVASCQITRGIAGRRVRSHRGQTRRDRGGFER